MAKWGWFVKLSHCTGCSVLVSYSVMIPGCAECGGVEQALSYVVLYQDGIHCAYSVTPCGYGPAAQHQGVLVTHNHKRALLVCWLPSLYNTPEAVLLSYSSACESRNLPASTIILHLVRLSQVCIVFEGPSTLLSMVITWHCLLLHHMICCCNSPVFF